MKIISSCSLRSQDLKELVQPFKNKLDNSSVRTSWNSLSFLTSLKSSAERQAVNSHSQSVWVTAEGLRVCSRQPANKHIQNIHSHYLKQHKVWMNSYQTPDVVADQPLCCFLKSHSLHLKGVKKWNHSLVSSVIRLEPVYLNLMNVKKGTHEYNYLPLT